MALIRTLDTLRDHNINITKEQYNNLLLTNERVIKELNNKYIIEYLLVELYDNGTIKKIEKRLDMLGILTLGITVVAIGTGVYFIGSDIITNAARVLL